MILLNSTTDLLRITTTTTANLDVTASWVTYDGTTTATPGRTATQYASIGTQTIIGAPGASQYRAVKTVFICNIHASSSNTVIVKFDNGTLVPELFKATLTPGDSLHYDEHRGWEVKDKFARIKASFEIVPAVVTPPWNTTVLGADVANSTAAYADVTALSFAVTNAKVYWFRFMIMYTSQATTNGSAWSINGPTITALYYKSEYSLSTTSRTINESLAAYNLPAGANATSAATGANHAWIEGVYSCGANGTVIARFLSEATASPAVTALKGSIVQWAEVI